MHDLINRQMAYDILSEYYHHRTDIQHKALKEALNLVPDAQPNVEDTISRQGAIDAVIAEGRTVDSHYLESERIIHESDAVEALSMLPSAQPERKTGKWIDIGSGQVCSECDEEQYGYDNFRFYCPNCGARMEGEE